MQQLIYILTIVILVSCGQRNNYISPDQTITSALDTITVDNYVLTFNSTDNFSTTDIYGDLNYRIKLTDTIDNWGNKAEKIQSYLLDKFGQYFYTTDSTLVLIFANVTTGIFSNNDDETGEFKHYYFEHYFDKIDYYLISVHLYEGEYWILVNRKSGFIQKICGLPYVSKDNQKIIPINSDLEAGYSFNGLELYSILADSLRTEFRKETKWGPTDLKWVNGNQFLIKREHFHVDSITRIQNNIIDNKLVTIEKKTSN